MFHANGAVKVHSALFATTLLKKFGFFSAPSLSLLLIWKDNICHIVELYVTPLWLIAVPLKPPKFSAYLNVMLLPWAENPSSW